jgi:hypothetical protein
MEIQKCVRGHRERRSVEHFTGAVRIDHLFETANRRVLAAPASRLSRALEQSGIRIRLGRP